MAVIGYVYLTTIRSTTEGFGGVGRDVGGAVGELFDGGLNFVNDGAAEPDGSTALSALRSDPVRTAPPLRTAGIGWRWREKPRAGY